MTAATSDALKGVEIGANKAVDQFFNKFTSLTIHDFVQCTPNLKKTIQRWSKMNNILGNGTSSTRDVVYAYK